MQPGDTLAGRYELLELIGHGGMGEVFRASDRSLGREVAVKVLPRHLLGDATATRRFRREAQLAAGLHHPDTVTVHDVVQEQDVEAIVMELVDGPTLADVLQDTGPLPWERAMGLAARVADALHAAHQRGLVHRDVKPSNVMLGGDGDAVKVTDFGIARVTQASQTVTGTVYGSVPYLAPEQALGETTDARTDVYGLGCLLYELLTGRTPYVADDAVGTIYQHLHADPVPPSERNPDLPAHVDAVVLRALEREPDARWESAAAFGEALRETAAGRDATALLPPPTEPQQGDSQAAGSPSRPVRGGRARRTPVRRSQPRRSTVPLIVAVVVVAFLTLWLLGAFDDSGATQEAPASIPTPTETSAPDPETTPTSAPEPSPTPSPTSSPSPSGSDVEAEARDVRSAIAGARQDGDLSAKAEEELDKLLTEVTGAHDEGDTAKALDKLDEMRDKLDDSIEKGEATEQARARLEPEFDDLEAALES